MIFTSMREVEEALAELVAVAAQTTGRNVTTARTFELAKLVGNPQDRLRVIHLAGTSGKTSTSYYIARLLQAGGAKTGLTVSPHITSITERVQIDGAPLSEAIFCEYMSEFFPLVTADKDNLPSYFEVMMVFALWVFDKLKVDYAVVETGLGGLHDSSNICRRADKLCVITDIGIDHTHVLGNTVEEIAAQKAGIIAPGNHVMMHEQSRAAMKVVSEYAEQSNADLTIVPARNYESFQERNFALAYAAYSWLVQNGDLPKIDAATLDEVRQTSVAGRFETVVRHGVKILRDGAHNEQKMAALVDTVTAKYPGQKWAVVLAMKDSKDYEAVIRLLAPITERAIATRFELGQDTAIRSVDSRVLANEFRKYDIECAEQPTIASAVDAFIDDGQERILLTGSLYALSQI